MQSEYETKVDLEEFLTYEDKRINQQREQQVQEQKEVASPGHFVINDDDEDPEQINLKTPEPKEKTKEFKAEEEKKAQVGDKPKQEGEGETFDESSDEEDKKEKKFFEEIDKLKNTSDQSSKPKGYNFKEIMVKGNRIEVELIEELRITKKLFVIPGKKEVKN